MKNRLSIFVALGLLLFVVACKKEGQDVWKYSNLAQGEVLKFDTPNAIINGNIDYSNLSGSSVSCKVYSYGVLKASKVVVYVSTNNTTDTLTWRKVKEFTLANDKATLAITATELATALGIPVTGLNPGSQYNLYNQVVTEDGQKFSIANTFGDYESNANYNHAFRWTATIVCPFNPTASAGNWVITTDGWDGAIGEVVSATTTANTLTMILFPYAAPPGFGPVTITVTPATGAATVARQTYGSYGTGFENFRCQGTGFVFSCTGRISLSLTHTLPSGTNYGTYSLRLSKL